MYDVELIAGISAPVDIPGYLYRSARDTLFTSGEGRLGTLPYY